MEKKSGTRLPWHASGDESGTQGNEQQKNFTIFPTLRLTFLEYDK